MLIKPRLTEKSAANLATGLYVYEVQKSATKPGIAAILKRDFKVTAVSIRIVNQKANKVTFRRRPGVQAGRKIAYIQLQANQSIPGFELPKSPPAESRPEKSDKNIVATTVTAQQSKQKSKEKN